MSRAGWEQLLEGWPWYRGAGNFPLLCYSEFMPPPYLVRKPYGGCDSRLLSGDDPWGWPVTEYEEALTLRPGLESVAAQLLRHLARLGNGDKNHGIGHNKLADNPCWSAELADRAGRLPHERYLLLTPLALSRTLDDKGRVRWTLFGGSEQGPARPFWRSFFTAPDQEAPAEQGLAFLRRLLHTVYGEPEERLGDLCRAGLRVLPLGDEVPFPEWREEPLPSWVEPLLWTKGQKVGAVRYLLTFRPFGRLPAAVRRAYLAGELHLLPCPASLLFWSAPGFLKLQRQLPFAVQVPLLQLIERHEGPHGLRVPQSGWLHEAHPDGTHHQHHGPVRNTYKRTHRTARVRRDEDELVTAKEHKLPHVLFSTEPVDVDLYNKPMARNVQMWTHHFELLLDGPRATLDDIKKTAHLVADGGIFGYRFLFPAMRVGVHEVYWQRPLVAYLSAGGKALLIPEAPTGYLTAYRADAPDLQRPLELWPRLLRREAHVANVELFQHAHRERQHATLENVRKLLDTWHLLGERPLPASFARSLLTLPKEETLHGWLESLPKKTDDPERARRLAAELLIRIEPQAPRLSSPSKPPASLTYQHTARRSFEAAYWKTIALLSTGAYVNKNNADPVLDEASEAARSHDPRDLDALAAYLVRRHGKAVTAAGLGGQAVVATLPFRWDTEYAYGWMGGWLDNQEGRRHEQNVLVMIPGRDRRRAVLMCDHFDTAYMEDHYNPKHGGTGARLAAAGADDNCSATATLLLGATVFLELSRAGKLACDIWLVHLTGEEYPAEGLGARRLCQDLVEGTLKARLADGSDLDLSDVVIQGISVLDMVAHNSNQDRDVFQISPGTTPEAMWLAYQAHLATETWNASLPAWNRRSSRRGRGRGRRSRSKSQMPPTAAHLHLHGEVRPSYDPRSTLYNTDGSTFSDAGLPVVLFMENYDITRSGYHDSQDTMVNINLDYGAALAAIAIEGVARMATEQRPDS